MSSLIYKLIGKHDLSNAIDKRHCCAADASDDADFTIITERPFAAVAELFTFFKRPLLAESGSLNLEFPERLTSALPPKAAVEVVEF